MDMLVMDFAHMVSILNVVPISNQKVFAPTAARALMIAHEDPFNIFGTKLMDFWLYRRATWEDSQLGLQRKSMAQRGRL